MQCGSAIPSYSMPHLNVQDGRVSAPKKTGKFVSPPPEANDQITGLIGIEPVVDFLKTVLWTGHVLGEKPVSVILVAPPGSGKTSVLSRLRSNWTYYTDDLTSREIAIAFSENPDMTHLVLSDMTSIFNRKNSTSELTCNILRRAIEEGMEVDSFTGRHHGAAKRIGFLTAIPPDDLQSRKISEQLEEGGFASRFIIAKYTYSQKTKRKIHDWIRSDAYTKVNGNNVLRFVERQSEVSITPKISQALNMLALDVKRDPLGARAHHHLRSLVKARALEQGRVAVTDADFNKVEEYAEFFSKRGKIL
jgi:hypothetical protein